MANRPPQPDMTPLASLAVLLGLIMMLAAVSESDRIPGWTDDHGTILTVMAVLTYLAVAGRALFWGLAELRTAPAGRR